MRALVFRYDVARYLASRFAYRLAPRLWTARQAPLRLERIGVPQPRAPGWARLSVRLSGICGTDLNMMTGRDSLYLEPEATYPFVPGHEIVATIEEGGSHSARPGTRVAVWPVLGCIARGLPPCAQCAEGWDGLCLRRDEHWPDRGSSVGFNRDTGGGWAESCLAHESQLWPLPDAVTDEDALLLDPACAALASLLRDRDPRTERTLIIGGGTIGLLAAYLHAQLGLAGSCELLARYEAQAAAAGQRGIAACTVRDDKSFHAWASDRGLRSRRVTSYGHVYQGEFDRVIDAAGTSTSMRWATRAVRPRGRIVMVTSPTDLNGVDPTPLWYREITVRGIYQYGPVPWEGASRHPFDVLLPRLANGGINLRSFVTHTFPLDGYVEAFHTLTHRRDSGAVKVAFRPGG
jgi:threonine dehydrogenase-like Zn-dependent dehydrogenase